jgi:outer membrane protein OmpA-like peptidoglycan-associated protein
MTPVVYFNRGGTQINIERYALILEEILTLVNEYPEARVEISAYCDLTGGEEINKRVARGRANAMLQYLVNQGVDAKRISFGYLGKERVLTGAAAYSAAARRVEVVLTDKE